MTTVGFLFLTLSTWMVLCGTWLSPRGRDAGAESAPRKNAVIRTFQLTVTCERDEITDDCASFASLPVNVMSLRGCGNTSERVQDAAREEGQSRTICRYDIQQVWVCSQSKTSCLLHRTQIMSKVSATRCSKESFLTQAGSARSVRPHASRWKVEAGFLATVLLFGTYVKRMILSVNSVAPASDSNSTMMMLLIMTLHRFSPPAVVQQLCEWPRVTAVISSALALSCVLIRATNMSLACNVACKMMKAFSLLRQRLWTLPFTFMFLTCNVLCLNKNAKRWIDDKDVGSTLRYWAFLELLGTLYCMFILLPSLLQFILMKLNFLSVHLHVQLVTCLQNSRVPTKYVLVMKIHRFM